MSRYTAVREAVRPLTVAYPQFQGATIQRTDPIAVFGQPMLSRYPTPQYLHETQDLSQAVVVGDVFNNPLPNLSAWPGRQYPLEVPDLSGATIQRTDPLLPFGKPLLSLYPGRIFPGAVLPLQGATIQDTVPIPGVAQIEMSRYRLIEAIRTIPGALIYLHQGATIQDTVPTPGVAKIEFSRYSLLDYTRHIPGAIAQQDQGPTILRTDPIPPVDKIEFSRYALLEQVRRLTLAYPQFSGATTQDTTPIPGVSPIEMGAYSKIRESVRLIPGAIPQFTGATIQQTNPIPATFGQSIASRYAPQQTPTVAKDLSQVAAVVQTDVFTLPQPNLAWWASRAFTETVSRTETAFIPVTTGTIEDRINLGMRIGVSQSDTFMGGFG
jgi:hypothetical protein